jgi:hypothetical protein
VQLEREDEHEEEGKAAENRAHDEGGPREPGAGTSCVNCTASGKEEKEEHEKEGEESEEHKAEETESEGECE